MGYFFKKLLIIAAITFLMATLIQILISIRIHNKLTDGRDHLSYFKNQKNTLIFVGNSRCTEHFDPFYFRDSLQIPALNLGVSGHGDFTMDMIELNNYIKTNAAPKVVIANIDPLGTDTQAVCINQNINFIGKNYYARYAFFPDKNNIDLLDYFKFNTFERYLPLYALLRYKYIFECFNLQNGNQWLKVGYTPAQLIWDSVKTQPTTNFNYINNVYIKYIDKFKERLSTFNSFCQENKMKLVCIYSPLYYTIYDKNVAKAMNQMCHELNIGFIDANDSSIIFDVNNFRDIDHLNITGIKKIEKVLVNDSTFKKYIAIMRQ